MNSSITECQFYTIKMDDYYLSAKYPPKTKNMFRQSQRNLPPPHVQDIKKQYTLFQNENFDLGDIDENE